MPPARRRTRVQEGRERGEIEEGEREIKKRERGVERGRERGGGERRERGGKGCFATMELGRA